MESFNYERLAQEMVGHLSSFNMRRFSPELHRFLAFLKEECEHDFEEHMRMKDIVPEKYSHDI